MSDAQLHHPWNRFVAIGDSFTEGLGDPDPNSPGGHRGWADRVAEELARDHVDFAYANLAVRGKLLRQIMDEQLGPALELQPDLVSICAGGNDVIRPSADPDALAETLDVGIAKLRSSGATLLLFTAPDTGTTPLLSTVRGRAAIFNENVRTIAARHDAIIADLWALRQLKDPRMWAPDRLHFSPLGHHIIAAMVLDALNVPHQLHPEVPAPLPPKQWRTARSEDLVWARNHLMPWVLRRLRHRSLGDGISAKRPLPEPIFGPGMPPGTAEFPAGPAHE
ncbi:SGNH/GDSL hydrolase family protein [Arthrobacter sp. I2-34]|uniref:SGNH/GDSL hydrolase family protein n=1 Tax=Arthrobacter hankyongi TaxID=2904801 RepID=A0ABS9L1C9_9MICC|nr:SGNH/GDSL hydrolase family protein [Arthrobacter hankyongi]MCG2620436.1 SGNH/GDSL hydrolase family protein [Arthrobacter hankyongi]